MNPSALSAFTTYLTSWLVYRAKHVDIPGFSIAVHANNQIIFSNAYGVAEMKHDVPLTAEHQFAVASQTKMLTSIAILQLVEKEVITLDSPICTYLPWLKAHSDQRMQKVTIRHLLCHSSGLIRDGKNDYWATNKNFPSKTVIHTLILDSPILFDPGAQLKYSNLGFALLGELISNQSGQTYEEYVIAHILQPLNCGATFTLNPSLAPTGYGLAFNHRRKPMKLAFDAKALLPVVGLYASPADMCKITAALYDRQNALLSEAILHTMRESRQAAFGYDYGTEFGLGLEMHYVSGRNLVGHSGHISCHLTATIYDPLLGVSVSVAANAKDAPCVTMARGIIGAFYYFLDNAPCNKQEAPFAVRLRSDISTIEVVQSGDSIAILDPDDWEPFAMPESAERIDSTVLRITTPGSVYNFGELIEYTFSGKSVDYVRFAGMKILPEKL